MKLYKYRSLQNLKIVLDILLSERLYCSTYDKLNDPFEGLFLTTISYGIGLPGGLNIMPGMGLGQGKVINNIKDINSESFQKTRICSLSSSINDVRLWSHYGDGHKGIAIEIDLPQEETKLHEVTYNTELPSYSASILSDPHEHVKVLTNKTDHWAYEAEYRIINELEYFNITDKISAIYLGYRINNNDRDLLRKIVSTSIPFIETTINHHKIIVEPLANAT